MLDKNDHLKYERIDKCIKPRGRLIDAHFSPSHIDPASVD